MMTNPRKLEPDWDFGYLVMKLLFKYLCKVWGRRWKGEIISIEDEHDLPPQIRIKLRHGGEYMVFIRRVMPDFDSDEEKCRFMEEHEVDEFYWEIVNGCAIPVGSDQAKRNVWVIEDVDV